MADSGFDVALIRVRFYTYSISRQSMQPLCVEKVRAVRDGAQRFYSRRVFQSLYASLSLHFSLAVHWHVFIDTRAKVSLFDCLRNCEA